MERRHRLRSPGLGFAILVLWMGVPLVCLGCLEEAELSTLVFACSAHEDCPDEGDVCVPGEPGGAYGTCQRPGCEGPPPTSYCGTENITLCYLFNDNIGTFGAFAVEDQSGLGVGGDVSDGSIAVNGVGGSLKLTKPSGALSVPATSTDSEGAWGVEFWIFPANWPAAGERQALIDKAGEWSVFLYRDQGIRCQLTQRDGGNPPTLFAPELPPLNTWTHVACTASDGELKLFVNGRLEGSHRTSGEGGFTGSDMTIGANAPELNEQFDGWIDDVRFFRTGRSTNDVCWSALGL